MGAPVVDGETSPPVAYQLVRVEGDGRLVAATDAEVMEVEHLLEDDKSELPSNEAMRCTKGCAPEGFSLKNFDLVGLSNSENTKLDFCSFDAGLEEERLLLSYESHDHSPKFRDIDGQSSDHPNPSHARTDKLQPDNTSVQTAPNSPGFNGSHNDQNGTVETFPILRNEIVTSRSSVSETCKSSLPDFSILEGEICLDDLSIRELQEAFRATFGRQTSVKDKMWLKRRIAMGLTNSCDIPTTRFLIKEKKIVHKEVKEASCMMSMSEAGSLSSDQVIALFSDDKKDSPTNTTNQVEDHQVVPGKKPSKPLLEYATKDESFEMEDCSGKRVRKPTKRYIEELSDVDIKEDTGRSISSVRSAGLGQSSSKSRIRSISDIASWGTTFVMKQHSFGGSNVPYASRLRRARPRKNFIAFTPYPFLFIHVNIPTWMLLDVCASVEYAPTMSAIFITALLTLIYFQNFINMKSEKSDLETLNSEELNLGHGKLDSAGDKSDNFADAVSAFKVCARRKHHRAWSLCEVLKLVEGVARYGAGRWSEIRRLSFASYPYRTSVDLKDKWRNLLRASYAQGSCQKSGRSSGNHTSIPIPRSILSRVRELSEMHSQSAVDFGPTRYAGDGGRTVQERSGFL